MTNEERRLMEIALAEFQKDLNEMVEDCVEQSVKYVQEEDVSEAEKFGDKIVSIPIPLNHPLAVTFLRAGAKVPVKAYDRKDPKTGRIEHIPAHVRSTDQIVNPVVFPKGKFQHKKYPEIGHLEMGKNAIASVDEARIRSALDLHPPVVVKLINSIHTSDKARLNALVRLFKPHKSVVENISGFHRSGKRGSSIFLIFGFKDSTLHHEIGHVVHAHSKTFKAAWQDIYFGSDAFDRHTQYSRKNDREGFADSYKAYVASGGKSTYSHIQRTFDAVKKVIDGIP